MPLEINGVDVTGMDPASVRPDMDSISYLAEKTGTDQYGDRGATLGAMASAMALHVGASVPVDTFATLSALPSTALKDGYSVSLNDEGSVYVYMKGEVPEWLSVAGFESGALRFQDDDAEGALGYWLPAGILGCVYCSDFGDLESPEAYVAVQQALDFAGKAGVRNVKMSRNDRVVPFIDGQIQIENSGVTFQMGRFLAGKDFRARVIGSPAEKDFTDLLAANTLEGEDIFQLANAANRDSYPVGSQIIVRGMRDIDTFYPLPENKQTYTVIAHVDADKLQVDRGVEVDFMVDYGQTGFEEKWGDPNYTRVYPVISTAITANVGKGTVEVAVDDASLFSVGDMVKLEDQSSPSDVSVFYSSAGSRIHNEVNLVSAVDVVNDIVQIAYPTATVYLSARNATLVKVDPVVNSHIVDSEVIWAGRTLNKTNAFEMAFGLNCSFSGVKTLGTNGFSWHRHAQRMSDCLLCGIREFKISGAQYLAGGEGYGAVTYGSNLCVIENGSTHQTRHGVLLARASSKIFTRKVASSDCSISDFDVHGNNNNDSEFDQCLAVFGGRHGSLQELPVTNIAFGATWDITVDATAVAANAENKVLVKGTGRYIPWKVSMDATGLVTMQFALPHNLEVADAVTVYSAKANAYNGDFTVTTVVDATTVALTPVAAISASPAQRQWVFSEGAYVSCPSRSIDGEWTVSSIAGGIISIDPEGASVPASVDVTQAWVSVHEGFTKAAFRTGNPTHFYGDFDIRFKRCKAIGYDPSLITTGPLHAADAVACDPQPGCYDIYFDVEAVDCRFVVAPQRNFKVQDINVGVTNQESNADVVTLDLTGANEVLSPGFTVELANNTRSDLNGLHKVTAVTETSFSFVVEGTGTWGSEVGDGDIVEARPYYDLAVQNATFDLVVRRTRQETHTVQPLYLKGYSDFLLKGFNINSLKFINASYHLLAEYAPNIKVRNVSHVWEMPSEPWAAMEAMGGTAWSQTNSYSLDIRDSEGADVDAVSLRDAGYGVTLAACPGATVKVNASGMNGSYVFRDNGGNDGSLFSGSVSGVRHANGATVVNEGTSAMRVIFEDVERPAIEITGDTVLGNIHYGRLISVTDAAVLSIPVSLLDGFHCDVNRNTDQAVSFLALGTTVKGDLDIAFQDAWASVINLAEDEYSIVGETA